MSVSQAILIRGKGTVWRVRLADEAIEYVNDGNIYQQEGVGMETYVIHSCPNMGEPFDSARHRAAQAIWDSAETIPKVPKNKKERLETISRLREIWSATK